MVVGNGMIAQIFKDYSHKEQFLIYASGVSNSKNTDPSQYEREKNMLEDYIRAYPNKTLVYFSTCSIYDPAEEQSPYVLHKKNIENIIKSKANSYNIFRVANVVGNSPNPNTIFNFFINHIKSRSPFILWCHAMRNLIDVEDLYATAHYILQNGYFSNNITNIANPESYYVTDIVAAIERHYNIPAIYELVDNGSQFKIDIDAIKPFFFEIPVHFGDKYLAQLLEKYAN